ncbi:trypsin-like [Battus philenor]|uniref:trypsin-like n=1 Tax=Battus philenor TaxID=42288 RepID=UPI0035CEC005
MSVYGLKQQFTDRAENKKGNSKSKSNKSDRINEEFVPRVVNGWPAKLGDVPYQVAFKALTSHVFSRYVTFCGGTIIAPAKILSAAHCFVEDRSACVRFFTNTGRVRHKELLHKYAVAGTLRNQGVKPFSDSTDEGQWRQLRDVFYPKVFKFPIEDIAVVMTKTPFHYTAYVNYLPYARRFADYAGSCLVSGYGRITSTGTAKSDRLLLAHLVIVPVRPCSIQHRRNMKHFVCTSSRVTDVGKGDSGGPLVCKGTGEPHESSRGILVGIVSGHRYGVGSFFTRVSSYHGYIESNKSNCINNKLLFVYLIIMHGFLPF